LAQQPQQQDTPDAPTSQGQRQIDALRSDLVRVMGHSGPLSLDSRMRFRLPSDLAATVHAAIQKAQPQSNVPAAASRLGFYFVPAPHQRIQIYPAQNIDIAVQRYERPPRGLDPVKVRKLRDYFYSLMTFVETDKQNRLQIPEKLCKHAKLDEGADQIYLDTHNLWLSISRIEENKQMVVDGEALMEDIGDQVVDPVHFRDSTAGQQPEQGQ
jgi:hypothetical protein